MKTNTIAYRKVQTNRKSVKTSEPRNCMGAQYSHAAAVRCNLMILCDCTVLRRAGAPKTSNCRFGTTESVL